MAHCACSLTGPSTSAQYRIVAETVNIRDLVPGDLFSMLCPPAVMNAYQRGDFGSMLLHVRFTRLPKRFLGTESEVTRVRFVNATEGAL